MRIKLSNISFSYEKSPILQNLTVEFPHQSFSSLLGASGSGKSSLIKIIAGTLKDYTGDVYFDDEEISGLSPAERKIGWVPQDQLLFPNLTVSQNIGYGLSRQSMSKIQRENRIYEISKLLRVEKLLSRYPSQISGGERQRVALSRAIAPSPKILLLDEPFSSLDAPLREKMAILFKKIHMETGVTTVHVTHAPAEAELISDRTFVLVNKQIAQSGSFEEIWKNPANISVARLISRPNVIAHSEAFASYNSVIIPDDAIIINNEGLKARVISKTRDHIHLEVGDIQLQKFDVSSKYLPGDTIRIKILEEKLIKLPKK